MRIVLVSLCLISAVPRMFGQAATGTFTGTVADPTGAVVASVGVEARNSETGVVYQAATTATGNYTITQLPVGTYEVLVKAPGFKTYSHANLAMPAGATIREDVTLEVGAATEAVTVTGQASLLSTESAEAAHNVTLGQLDNLPLLGIGHRRAQQSPTAARFGIFDLFTFFGFGQL